MSTSKSIVSLILVFIGFLFSYEILAMVISQLFSIKIPTLRGIDTTFLGPIGVYIILPIISFIIYKTGGAFLNRLFAIVFIGLWIIAIAFYFYLLV